MQRNISTSHGGSRPNTINNSKITSQFFNQLQNDVAYPSLYSSIFPPNPQRHLSLLTPTNSSNPTITTTTTTQYSPNQYQDIIDSHHTLLSHLLDAQKESQSLRQENINLKIANINLTNRLSLFLQTNSLSPSSFDYATSSGGVSESVAEGFGRMSIHAEERRAWDNYDVSSEEHDSPTSVIGSHPVENTGVERVTLPKSISIRSSGYLKAVRAPNRVRTRNDKQRVYLPGGKKEGQPLELEVYNQGMFKTELCNKWQQTGSCPYGDQCQFAHGIGELRPVLRHPRYKTEVCRMVLNGDHCPYGHRCHFRHALTDEERLIAMGSIKTQG